MSYQFLERETGIEPATNSLEGCDSTTELLPQIPHRVFISRGSFLANRMNDGAKGKQSKHYDRHQAKLDLPN
jgi:hypothetical protein